MALRVYVRAVTLGGGYERPATCGILMRMAGKAEGFEFVVVGTAVEIRHHGRKAATLRKDAARAFLTDVERRDPQELMARVTGNYKRGNERSGRRRNG